MDGRSAVPERAAVRGNPVAEGTILFRPGDPCAGFVVVHAGSIRVTLTAENGREIILYCVGPGDVCLQTFGCLVRGGLYSAEARAEAGLRLEMLPAGRFRERVAADDAFRDRLFAAVASRFADLERLVEEVALEPVATRLARALLRLAGGAPVLSATHEMLATEIGSAREVVSRQLGRFVRAGLVTVARGSIGIVDVDALRRIAWPAGGTAG